MFWFLSFCKFVLIRSDEFKIVLDLVRRIYSLLNGVPLLPIFVDWRTVLYCTRKLCSFFAHETLSDDGSSGL